MNLKKLIIVLLCSLPAVTAFSQGIQFEKGTAWDAVLKQAKLANKLVFVDVYTDWCGPCKRMEQEVFPDKQVGEKFNAGFINYRLDAEKGAGPKLADRYHVVSYPTYLFINGDGTLIYRANGYMPAYDFLNEAHNADREKTEPITLLQLDSAYATHKTDTAFLYNYLQRRTKLRQDNTDLIDSYISQLDPASQSSMRTLQLIADNGAFRVRSLQVGPALAVLLAHPEKFKLIKDFEDTGNYISQAQNNTLNKAIAQKNEQLLRDVLVINKKRQQEVFSDETDDMFRLKYYYATGQYKLYNTLATRLLDKTLLAIPVAELERKDSITLADITAGMAARLAKMPAKDAQEELYTYRHTQSIQVVRRINNLCGEILKMPIVSKTMLTNGKRWLRHSLMLNQRDLKYYHYMYPPTLKLYAAYLYKSGQAGEAINYQAKALKFATANDPDEAADYSRTLSLMKQHKPLTDKPAEEQPTLVLAR